MECASIIKKLRIENGLTQQEVADRLFMDRSTYTYYEIGRTKPSIEFLIDLAHLHGVSWVTLLHEPPLLQIPADGSGPRFSQLNHEEQKLVILYRSGSPALREALLTQAEIFIKQ